MSDKSQYPENTDARKVACGYRIQTTCASCKNCRRTFHAKGHATQMMSAHCDYKDFPVNLDRGICEFFDNIGKYRT